jgi:hypothetical protein
MHAPELVALLAGRRVAVLTGAGISTDSGIPDYRGPDSPPANPMTIRQFTSSREYRQRYWARNHLGWRHMAQTQPNAGHRALAALERAGVVTGVITQNVDLLHTKAGSRAVINLHGTYAMVVCLDCGHTMSREALAEKLETANPGFAERAHRVGGLAVVPTPRKQGRTVPGRGGPCRRPARTVPRELFSARITPNNSLKQNKKTAFTHFLMFRSVRLFYGVNLMLRIS